MFGLYHVWHGDLAMFNGLRQNYHEQIYNIASISSMTSEQCTKIQSGFLNSVRKDNIYGSTYHFHFRRCLDFIMFDMVI